MSFIRAWHGEDAVLVDPVEEMARLRAFEAVLIFLSRIAGATWPRWQSPAAIVFSGDHKPRAQPSPARLSTYRRPV